MITDKKLIRKIFNEIEDNKILLEMKIENKIYIGCTNINIGTISIKNENKNGVLNYHIDNNNITITLMGKEINLKDLNIYTDVNYITFNEDLIIDINKTLEHYKQSTFKGNLKGLKALENLKQLKYDILL